MAIVDRLQADADTHTLKRRSVRGAAATAVAQGTRMVVQLSSQVVLAHFLSPADFGLIAMVSPVISFVQVFNDLGLSQAIIQKPEITRGELSTLFWANVAIGVSLAALVMLTGPGLAWFYGQPELTGITAGLALLLLTSGLSSQQIALMNRGMRFTTLAAIDITCALAGVAVGLAAAASGMGYWSLVLMQVANGLTITCVSWLLSDWRPQRPTWDRGVLPMLRFGGFVAGGNIVQQVGANVDNVLLGAFRGDVALGFYDRANRLVVAPIAQSTLPISRVAVSLLSRLVSTPDRYRTAFARMLEAVILFVVPGLFCLATASVPLVTSLLGARWAPAAPIVTWLAIAGAFTPFGYGASWLFTSQGRGRDQLTYVVLKSAVLATVVLAGVTDGAVGVARAIALGAVLVQGSVIWGATRRGPVDLRWVLRAAWPVVFATLAAAAALQLADARLAHLPIHPLLRVAADLVLGYAMCGAALMCFPAGRRVMAGVRDLARSVRRGAAAA